MSALTRWGFDRKAGAAKRPVPLVRAYRGPWPILSHRTMAEVMRDEEEERLGRPVLLRELNERPVVQPEPKKKAKPRIKSGATEKDKDCASRRRGSAGALTAEQCRSQAGEKERPGAGVGQSSAKGEQKARTPTEYQAKAGDEAAGTEHASPRPAVEPVSRPAAGRAAAATSEFMDVTAGETAPVPNPAEAAPPKQASAPVAVMAALPLAVSTRPAPARAPISTRGEGGRGKSVPPLTQQGPATTRQPEKVATGNVAKQEVSPSADALTGRALKTAKIDIAAVPSGMEAAALKWKAPEEQHGALPPVPGEDGKVWCAGCDARVPTWFGRACISATCSLKGSQ